MKGGMTQKVRSMNMAFFNAKKCSDSRMDNRILTRLMTLDNKMDPFLWATLHSSPKLTDIEEIFIARVRVVMKAH